MTGLSAIVQRVENATASTRLDRRHDNANLLPKAEVAGSFPNPQSFVDDTMTSKPAFPPQLCPLCGEPNQCAMELERATGIPQSPCWCTQAQFSAELLNKIPEAARGVACLCAACVKASQA